VSDVVKRLGTASTVVADASASGQMHVVGASYDLSTGAVTLV
jgi:carbonic anhydrase